MSKQTVDEIKFAATQEEFLNLMKEFRKNLNRHFEIVQYNSNALIRARLKK